MTIRPLEHADLPAVVALYAEIDRYAAGRPTTGYREFFARTLLEDPELVDPELPSYVYEDEARGVVGVIGSHARRYRLGERRLRFACAGPLIVHPDFRTKGLGALLLRRFAAGPQDVSSNDRSSDDVHTMWRLLGGATDGIASVEWTKVLAPVGAAAARAARRATRLGTPLGGGVVARVSKGIGRSGPAAPATGSSEPLTPEALIELVERLARQYRLRPEYTPGYLESIFALLGQTVLGTEVVRRLVRDDNGRAVGAYVMIVAPHGRADVINLVSSFQHAGLTVGHLFHDAAAAGAVEVAGRGDTTVLAELYRSGCDLRPGAWVTVYSADEELTGLILGGRALTARMEGEWWMRPRPQAP